MRDIGSVVAVHDRVSVRGGGYTGGTGLVLGGKPIDANLSLNDGRLVGLVENVGNTCELLVSGDGDGLDEELVAALGVERRLLLHGLKENGNLYILSRLDTTRVGANTVLLRSGGFNLESDRGLVRVLDSEDLSYFDSEGPSEAQLGGLDIDRHGGSCGEGA